MTNPDVKKNEKLPFGSSFVSLVECTKPSLSCKRICKKNL
jgi:hypothetical protein